MVSIIMPVYNSGIFLNESIGSILIQTYKDFELICIDDHSQDIETKTLLEKYAAQDNRIRLVMLPKNVGAAEARNTGFKMAQGEYIIFLDADDIFDCTMIEKMHGCISQYDVDMCICGFRHYLNDKKEVIDIEYPREKSGITDQIFSLKEMNDDGLMYWSNAPWNKMCRKDFLIKNGIFFQSLPCSNDVFFSYMCSVCAKKIMYCLKGEPLLYYRRNHLKQISANRNPLYCFLAIIELVKRRESSMDMKEYRQIIYALMLGSVYEFQRCEEEKNRRCYDLISSYLRSKADNLVFDGKAANNVYKYYKEESYDSYWFKVRGDFYIQLKRREEVILQGVCGKGTVVIWGNGARGRALQRLFREHGMGSFFVTDIKNEDVGKKTRYGYKIIHTTQVAVISEIIIATNGVTYEYLKDKYGKYDIEIVNLALYCPFE